MRSAKFWVAVVMAIFAFVRSYTGTDFGVDETIANTIVAAITAALVWLIPNKKPPTPMQVAKNIKVVE